MDIYNETYVDQSCDDDALSGGEEGFMKGYLDAL